MAAFGAGSTLARAAVCVVGREGAPVRRGGGARAGPGASRRRGGPAKMSGRAAPAPGARVPGPYSVFPSPPARVRADYRWRRAMGMCVARRRGNEGSMRGDDGMAAGKGYVPQS